MALQIPQSFKVQWLNSTLKFIKDDTQLVKDYPQMPSSHVEYLHNLIWQRKNDEGLGFKSLYSPVWEAMKIYSIKYKFKFFVEKSEDGMSGYLKMEKIPKTGQKVTKLNDEKKDMKNNDEKKERKNETMNVKNDEVIKKTQTEAVKCKQPELESKNKPKTKKSMPRLSKNRKMIMENQKMLDSLSPLFIKTTLKSILSFIIDELSASKIFSNLAPIESRFLENFFSIIKKKNDLEVLLSPACNETLMEISNCFEDFSKTYSLDISSVEINTNTNKREVKFTKVPTFTSKEKAKQKLNENSIHIKPKTISTNETTKIVNVHPISKEQLNITVEKNVSKETKNCKFINKTNILQNNAISEDRYGNRVPIDKVIQTIDNNVKEAFSTFEKKADDVKPKTTTHLKDTSFKKSIPLPKKSISFTEEGISSTADDTPHIRVDQKSPKVKIVQDMTMPINNDKVVSVPLPKKSMNFTNEGTSSITDTPYITVDQKSSKKQDTTVPINSDKALSQNYEIIKKSQTEAVKCKQGKKQEPEPRKAKTKKPIPQMSKGLIMFIENQNILDSLSPLFIKTTLKSILGFITDELSTSMIFSNLAPIESKFLENFLSIYQRKNELEVVMPTSCNEIITEISNCFEDFNKTHSLHISSVEINSNTNKREVIYTKAPVLPKNKKAKRKLKENSIEIKSKTISTKETTKFVNVHPISKDQLNITVEKNVSKETKNIKFINKTNILQNNAISEERYGNSVPIDKVIQTIDNNVIEALSTFVKKADDVKRTTTTYLKDTSLKKSIPLPKKSISFTKEGTSNAADTPHIRVDQKSPRMKILQDMTVPINSDKAVKMMQLMGWKGGPLGLRGDGIMEPIIPAPNYKACGLGHVSVKKDSNKKTMEYIRSEFVNKILKMIDNNINVSVIKIQNQLKKREIKFLKVTLQVINNRMNLDPELEKRLEIEEKMIRNMDIIFNLDFEDNNRKIIITKSNKTEMKPVNQDTKNKTKSENSEATFKTIVLKAILELLKSEDNEKVIQFNKELKAKHINCSSSIILLINEGQIVQQKNSSAVAELGSKVLEAIGDIVLSVSINESERYIVIRKKHPRNNVNQENIKTIVNKVEKDENNCAFDNVRGHLKNKKKFKLLNALYKYQMDNTEEFRENKWYNTVDKCLLDSETMSKIINDTEKEIHNNITKYIKRDQNNNEGIAANFKI